MLTSVFVDTNILIYFLESTSPFHGDATGLMRRLVESGVEVVSSDLTLGEMLVVPVRDGNTLVERACMQIREEGLVRFVPFDHMAALHFARIRAARTVKPPDAIQLACCAAAGCDLFITNDDRLSRIGFPGVPMVSSLSASPV